MYIVSITYKVPLDQIDKYLNAHVEYLKEQYAVGIFLASGRKVPRDGGIILAKAANKDELMKVLEKDPFNQNNLADYQITEFIPSMTCDELASIKEL